MKKALIFFILFMVFYNIETDKNSKNVAVVDRTLKHLTRNKRFLVWKEGVNWVAMIFGLGIPFEIGPNSVTLGMFIKAYYQLPDNSSYYTHPNLEFERKKRSMSRWTIYQLIEHYMKSNHHMDGKACLLKSICEVAAIKLEERSGLLAEIVHTVLTPSTTKDDIQDHSNYDYHAAEKLGREIGNCDQLYPECPIGPIGQFSRLMIVSKYIY